MQATWTTWDPPPAGPAQPASAAAGATPTGAKGGSGVPGEPLLALHRRLLALLTSPAERVRLLRAIVEEAARLVDASAAALIEIEPGGEAVLRIGPGIGRLAEREGALLPAEASFAGRALLSGEPQQTPDLSQDRRAYHGRRRKLPLGPALAAPLSLDGTPVAVLLLARDIGAAAFEPTELELLAAAAEAFAAALKNANLYHQARDSRAELDAWRREQELAGWADAYEATALADSRVVFRWDVEAGVFHWAGALAGVVGYSPGEFGTSLEVWTAKLREEDRDRVRGELRRSLRDAEAIRCACRIVHKSGAFRQLLVRTVLPDDPASGFLFGTLEDVTERERLAGQRDQRARAGAASEIIRALRHEINNPLAVVIGQLQLLQQDGAVRENGDLHRALHAIQEESERMHELVRRLATLEQHPREPFINRAGGVNLPEEVKR